MDDSDTRRGNPACHIAFDEATAILAGDALQTLAFELLAMPRTHADGGVRAALVMALARAAGLDGMAGGQMLDLEAETRPMVLDEVRQMQAMKTGALIQFAAVAGGIHGQADEAVQAALERYSRDLGLAFQIADDLLDYDSDSATLGKPAGQDADRGKASFVVLMGLEQARRAASGLIAGAERRLTPGPLARWRSRQQRCVRSRDSLLSGVRDTPYGEIVELKGRRPPIAGMCMTSTPLLDGLPALMICAVCRRAIFSVSPPNCAPPPLAPCRKQAAILVPVLASSS